MTNVSNEEERYDFVVVGAGAAGSVLAAELSASGAQVLVIESGGPDDAPTIANPSIWFCRWHASDKASLAVPASGFVRSYLGATDPKNPWSRLSTLIELPAPVQAHVGDDELSAA